MRKFYCPVNGWDCPYFKKDGSCAIVDKGENPVLECDDAAMFWEEDDDYFVEEQPPLQIARPPVILHKNFLIFCAVLPLDFFVESAIIISVKGMEQ